MKAQAKETHSITEGGKTSTTQKVLSYNAIRHGKTRVKLEVKPTKNEQHKF